MENPILGIHHIAIIVSDYEVSKRFYTEIIGGQLLREAYRSERKSHKADLLLPCGTQIELFTFEGAPARLGLPHSKEALGLRHLALAVADIRTAIGYLDAKGIAHEGIRTDHATGKHFTFFQDPDLLPIELYEK